MSNLMNGHKSFGHVATSFDKPRVSPRRGTPLPDEIRRNAEELFGEDFSDVRVIVSDAAPKMGAIAFTTGSEIHIAPGVYRQGTEAMRVLLGRELAHVVQQRRGRAKNPYGYGVVVVRDPGLEAEADRMGHALQMMSQNSSVKLDTILATLFQRPSAGLGSDVSQGLKEDDVYLWRFTSLVNYQSKNAEALMTGVVGKDEIEILLRNHAAEANKNQSNWFLSFCTNVGMLVGVSQTYGDSRVKKIINQCPYLYRIKLGDVKRQGCGATPAYFRGLNIFETEWLMYKVETGSQELMKLKGGVLFKNPWADVNVAAESGYEFNSEVKEFAKKYVDAVNSMCVNYSAVLKDKEEAWHDMACVLIREADEVSERAWKAAEFTKQTKG